MEGFKFKLLAICHHRGRSGTAGVVRSLRLLVFFIQEECHSADRVTYRSDRI